MREWSFAQTNPGEGLTHLHLCSVKKKQDHREIEFRITVHEYGSPRDGSMRFFAEADKETSQSCAPCTPCGWASMLLKALSECVRNVHSLPYQGGATE